MDLTSLSLEQKVGQLFFIGIPGPELESETRDLLDEVRPGGVCLFARNIKTRDQTRELTDALRDRSEVVPFLSIDEEGGLVDRLRRIMTPMPAAGAIDSAADASELGGLIGESLSLLGFNMNFAPVVDVVDAGRTKFSQGLSNRPFGKSGKDVVTLAGAFLESLQAHNILGCLKHFPGLGAATVDSHEELPVVEISDEELKSVDLLPYVELLHEAPAVMIAHAAFPNTGLQERDQNGKLLPSSLSAAFITTLLREQLGYTGLAITDDLEMGAIIKNYGIPEACKMAANAGADMLAVCADQARIVEGYRAVLGAIRSGEISGHLLDNALARIAATKSSVPEASLFDHARLDEISTATAVFAARLG